MSESFIDFRFTSPEGVPRRVIGPRRAFELLYGPFVEASPEIEPNPNMTVRVQVQDETGDRKLLWETKL